MIYVFAGLNINLRRYGFIVGAACVKIPDCHILGLFIYCCGLLSHMIMDIQPGDPERVFFF